jgi:hypothetical protein
VATSARVATAAAIVGLLVGLFGCSSTTRSTLPSAAASRPPRASADALGAPIGTRTGAIPATWQQAIAAGALPHGTNERLFVDAVSPDGRLVFAESQVDGARPALLMIRKPAWHRSVIQPLAAGARVVGVAFDGRYLTFTEAPETNPDRWTLWVWDSRRAGAPREIAHNAVDVTGLPVPGPTNRPSIDHGHVFWVQGDEDGTDNVRMYTISSGTTALIRRGRPGTPFIAGRLLIWPELHGSASLTALTAISLDTLRPARVPSLLASIHGPTSICANPDAVAWVDASRTELHVWRRSWPTPRLGVRSAGGTPLGRVHVSGSVVTWSDTRADWALDLRTMVFVEIAAEAGGTGAWGSSLAFGDTATHAGESILNTAALPPL